MLLALERTLFLLGVRDFRNLTLTVCLCVVSSVPLRRTWPLHLRSSIRRILSLLHDLSDRRAVDFISLELDSVVFVELLVEGLVVVAAKVALAILEQTLILDNSFIRSQPAIDDSVE